MRGHQADDLPVHAFKAMQVTLDLCGEVFPGVPRSDLQRTFVDAYFNPPASIKRIDSHALLFRQP